MLTEDKDKDKDKDPANLYNSNIDMEQVSHRSREIFDVLRETIEKITQPPAKVKQLEKTLKELSEGHGHVTKKDAQAFIDATIEDYAVYAALWQLIHYWKMLFDIEDETKQSTYLTLEEIARKNFEETDKEVREELNNPKTE